MCGEDRMTKGSAQYHHIRTDYLWQIESTVPYACHALLGSGSWVILQKS